jgi:hypothetical protein
MKEILAERLGEIRSWQMKAAVKSPTPISLASGAANGSFRGFPQNEKCWQPRLRFVLEPE